jgi:geranylgeranyl diphosphate synthase, type II
MKDIIELSLKTYIETLPKGSLKDAMSYALLAGGKRIRPLLMLHVIESLGVSSKLFVDVSISLELLHTYSLIHDDLPAMDDDTLRRGKPTLHIAFNEGLAILAGDALLTDAFHVISTHPHLTAEQKIQMVHILSSKAGSHGMILGQVLDLASEGQAISLEQLKTMYILKTSRLLEAAMMMGAVASNVNDIETFELLARDLGLFFQIQDDYLEKTTDTNILGKSKSDDERDKPTYVSILGLTQTKKYMDSLSETIKKHIKSLSLEQTLLSETIDMIIQRQF